MKYKQLKHLRTFEIDKPQVGDYVLMNSVSNLQYVSEYILTHIGRITEIYYNGKYVIVRYDAPPYLEANFKKGLRQFDIDFILHFSKNKEDLETIINSNKYNL